ncbi:hypothetical protein FC65_GL001900 [Ligilactobacillus acidipiscis DSM 15836]|uniref:Uncharacterized protein n=2 Tax=Ligilactobacillus acidipiscis TaxID=89059 RepID=A0A0R2KBQ9_9LACO|nr:hypothetical protein FC65_GL001900 [Ligilactobacillus acidipiscis DSM 15836]KRN86895.1 hypothetical protein IV43_GL000324 [Ligilactobacillus acidipiscis]
MGLVLSPYDFIRHHLPNLTTARTTKNFISLAKKAQPFGALTATGCVNEIRPQITAT